MCFDLDDANCIMQYSKQTASLLCIAIFEVACHYVSIKNHYKYKTILMKRISAQYTTFITLFEKIDFGRSSVQKVLFGRACTFWSQYFNHITGDLHMAGAISSLFLV